MNDKVRAFALEQISQPLPVPDIQAEMTVVPEGRQQPFDGFSGAALGTEKTERPSLSMPITSQPSSHKVWTHAEPIRPPAPVTSALAFIRALV
jgi:hypothetical protein